MPCVWFTRTTDRVRKQRNELLRDVSDRRKIAGRPSPIPTPQRKPTQADRGSRRLKGWALLSVFVVGSIPLHTRRDVRMLSLIHISEPTRRTPISYAVFC